MVQRIARKRAKRDAPRRRAARSLQRCHRGQGTTGGGSTSIPRPTCVNWVSSGWGCSCAQWGSGSATTRSRLPQAAGPWLDWRPGGGRRVTKGTREAWKLTPILVFLVVRGLVVLQYANLTAFALAGLGLGTLAASWRSCDSFYQPILSSYSYLYNAIQLQ
jgi:hypothetical protein